jgi:hypothetical protein
MADFKWKDALAPFDSQIETSKLQDAWSGIRTHTRSLLRRAARPIGVSRQSSGGGNRTDVSWFKARHVAITPPRNDLPSEPPFSSVMKQWGRRESNPHPLIKSQVRCRYDHDPIQNEADV